MYVPTDPNKLKKENKWKVTKFKLVLYNVNTNIYPKCHVNTLKYNR